MPKMDNFLHESHQGDPNMTLLHVLNVLNIPKEAPLARWALFSLLHSLFFFLIISFSSHYSPSPFSFSPFSHLPELSQLHDNPYWRFHANAQELYDVGMIKLLHNVGFLQKFIHAD